MCVINLVVLRHVHSISCQASSLRSAISCFPFQFPLSSCLTASSTSLRLLPRPPITSIFFFLEWRVSEGSSYARCDQSCWLSLCLFYVGYSSPPALYEILLHFSNPSPASHFKTLLIFPIHFPNYIVSVNKFAMIFELPLLCRKIFQIKFILYYILY